jgi:hypothetical protein
MFTLSIIGNKYKLKIKLWQHCLYTQLFFENNGKSSFKHGQLKYPSQSYNIRL